MNLLIVDDQPLVTDGLEQGIPWELRILEFRMRGEEDHPGIHAALPHPRK